MEYTLNSYIISHVNGKSESVDAETAEKALQSVSVPESQSKVKQVIMLREGIRVSVPDIPDKIALTVTVENDGVAENPQNHAFPSLAEICVGDIVELGADADDRYSFLGWYRNGIQIGTNRTLAYQTVQADSPALELIARFVLDDIPFSVSALPSGSGTAFCSVDSVRPNSTIRFMATPDPGYAFSHWERDGETVSTDAVASITVVPKKDGEDSVSYIAVFSAI